LNKNIKAAISGRKHKKFVVFHCRKTSFRHFGKKLGVAKGKNTQLMERKM